MVLTDSQIVVKAFGMKHLEVMYQVENIMKTYPDLSAATSNHQPNVREYIRLEEREYHGTKFKAATMNKPFFTLLMTRFITERARQLQLSFNRAFHTMEAQLAKHADKLEWKVARLQGVKQRKDLTDVIKQFADGFKLPQLT